MTVSNGVTIYLWRERKNISGMVYLNNLPRSRKKHKVTGVSCTVYKPFEEQVTSLNLPSTLSPLFEELDPKPGFLRIWPDKDKDIPLVETKYGLVPRGSVLSYQQQQTSKRSSENLAHPVPNFDLPDLGYQRTVLAEKELLHFNSLKVSLDQALEYEQMTRDQSQCVGTGIN